MNEREGSSFKGRERIKYLSAAPDFIRTQLHAKSVICSNRGGVLIGSLMASAEDTCPKPQPKIIRRKGGAEANWKGKGHLSHQYVSLGGLSCMNY
jgi:hypothetical protein